MSHLVAAIFDDEFRAQQALIELRRHCRRRADFENTLLVTWQGSDLIVQQNVNVTNSLGPVWGRLWGSLLRSALIAVQCEIEPATKNFKAALAGDELESIALSRSSLDWWRTELELPADFLRDFGALLKSGSSAFLFISKGHSFEIGGEITRSYGGTFMNTRLVPKQMAKLRNELRRRPDDRQNPKRTVLH